MSQPQVQNKDNMNSLDANWRDDALDLELDYGMQTIALPPRL